MTLIIHAYLPNLLSSDSTSSSSNSSNFIFLNGSLEIGRNSEINPDIFSNIETEYNIDSGKTSEYHATNSPNAKSASPVPTANAPFVFLLEMKQMFQLHHTQVK